MSVLSVSLFLQSIAVRSFPLNIGGVTDALSSAFACSTGSECLHSNSIASRTARLQALYLHLIQQTMFAPANLTEQLPSASVVSSISAVRKLRALAFMLLPPPAMMQSSLALR